MRSVNDRQLMTLVAALLPNVDLDQLNLNAVKTAIEDPKSAGEHLVRFINAGCRMPTRLWYEENGVIRLSSPLIADGTTGADWITRLEGAGKSLSRYAKSVLLSADFVPSPAGTPYNVAILKGLLFSDNARTTANIRANATELGLTNLNAEVACLFREKFSDDDIKDMGLSRIVAMHYPIEDSDGDPSLLGANRFGDGHSLCAYFVFPGHRWCREHGFAFAV